MLFWKLSITVLLVVASFTLASIQAVPKVHALELVPQSTLKGFTVPVCPATDFISLGKNSCKSQKKEPFPIFTVKSQLIPTLPLKEPVVEDVKPTATLSASTLFQLVNDYRKQISMAPFEQDARICNVAESRRFEMPNELFITHALHSGFYAKNLPYWATENMIYQNSEEEALQWWLNSPIHKSAIQGNYKYACGVCNGEVCNMIFTNYEEKVLSLHVPNTVATK